MGVRGATVWVILAGLLGAVVLWVRTGDDAGEQQRTMLLGLDSASVIGLRVERENLTQSLTRGLDGLWVLELANEKGSPGLTQRWPAKDSRVRGGVRLLASTEFGEREAGPADAGSSPIGSLTIQLRGGIETEIVFEGRGVGGRVPVSIRSGTGVRWGWADRTLLETYLDSGLSSWRDVGLGSGAAQADSFTIEALGDRVGLRRVGGRWVLQDPVAIEADQSVVESVLGKLGELQIERFLDGADPTDKAYGLENPVGFIRLGWSGQGSESGKSSRGLELGSRADAAGEVLHAKADWQIGESSYGPRVVTVLIPDFPVSAAAYLRKEASSLSTSDIRGLSVRRRSDGAVVAAFTRTIDGWELGENEDLDGVGESVSTFVCDRPASVVELVTQDEIDQLRGYQGEIGLIVGSGVEAEVFSVALPTPESPMLRLVGGDLGEGMHAMWSFGGPDADELVTWFADQFGL